jgi:hypothetical protein
MANTSKDTQGFSIDAPVLPKGGGAISGTDGAFKIGGMTGTLSFGIGGLQYEASAGNGAFGMGFGMAGMGSIARRVSHGTPAYDDDVDEFTLDDRVLVPVTNDNDAPLVKGGYFEQVAWTVGDVACAFQKAMLTGDADAANATHTVGYYRPRSESAFSQIEHWKSKSGDSGAPASDFWRVIDAANNIRLFGVGTATHVSDPGDGTRIFQWLAQETLTPAGNASVILYKAEDADGVDTSSPSEANRSQTAQKYIERICSEHRYPYPEPVSFVDGATLGQLESVNPWYFEMVFDYGEYALPPDNPTPYLPATGWSVRLDSHSSYHAGFEIRTHRLCRRMLSFNRVAAEPGGTPLLTAATRHHYAESSQLAQLVAVEEIAFYFNADAGRYEYMASVPEEISYTAFQPAGRSYGVMTRSDGGPLPSGGNFAPIDLYGEGIPGFLFTDGETRHFYRVTWESLAAGGAALEYARADITRTLPGHFLQTDAEHRFMDITGDGNLDYVVLIPGQSGYYEYSSEDDAWSDFRPFPGFPLEGFLPQHYFVDLTGDGVSDLVVLTDNRIRYYQNLKAGGFAPASVVTASGLPASLINTPDDLFAFAAMSGDGKAHLTHVTRHQVTYWPNLGYGRFAGPVVMENVGDLGEKFRSDRVFFADLDGDGAVDLIVVSAGDDGRALQLNIYMNQSGNSYADPIAIQFPEGVCYNDLDQVYFADILGNGTQCLVYSQTHPAVRTWYYDFCGGTKPYLVAGKINNLGAAVSFAHTSSVHFYLEDQSKGIPWIVRAPFPMQLASEAVSVDAWSKNTLTSSNRYRHAYYDGVEREFRGFGYSESQDTMVFDDSSEYSMDSPPSLTKQWFHLGADDQDSLSRQFAAEYYGGDARAAQLSDSVVVDLDGSVIGADTVDARQAELYREAQMALKGMALRCEVYGLDGSARSANPYTTTEVNGSVRILQDKGGNQYAVVLVLPREQLTYDYQRNPDDPLYGYSATLQFDAYGHPLQKCDVVFPRRAPAADSTGIVYQEQQKLRLTCMLSAFDNLTDAAAIGAGLDDDDVYLLGIALENQVYAIATQSADGTITLAQTLGYAGGATDTLIAYDTLRDTLQTRYTPGAGFAFADAGIGALARLGTWGQQFYMYPTTAPSSVAAQDDGIYSPDVNTQEAFVTPFALGRVGSRATLIDWYKDIVAYDKASIEAGYAGFFGDMNWGSAEQAMTGGGRYITKEEGNYWWQRTGYVVRQQGTAFFHPMRAYDPLGVMQAQVQYDDYLLYLVSHTDAFGNTQTVQRFDYQYLVPTQIVDINANTDEVLLDASGTVVAASFYGSETRYLKNGAKTAPDDLDAYHHELTGFGPLTGFDAELYDDTGMELPRDMSAVVANPRAWLQDASAFFYYDKFAWTGQITRQDLSTLSAGSGAGTPDTDALWNNLTGQGYIGYTGAIMSATRMLSADQLTLDPGNQPYAASLVGLFASKPAGTCPVNSLGLTPVQFPRIFPEDLRDIVDGNGKLIAPGNWTALWNDLANQGYIDADGLVAPQTWQIASASDLTLNPADQTYRQSLFDYLRSLSPIVIGVSYNDGFGRVVQTKALIEDGADCMLYDPSAAPAAQITASTSGNAVSPRWLTEGHLIYNNKGALVKQYEPYFIDSPAYIDYQVFDQSGDPAVAALRTSTATSFDALGRTPYVITNKGFLNKTDWTAWETSSYDSNDCFIDSPYWQDNISRPDASQPYYNDELSDLDRAILANPALYPAQGDQMSAQGLAYFKTLQQAWTPTVTSIDNRGNTLVNVALDNHRFTAGDFESVAGNDAGALFGVLQQKAYLDDHGYLGAALTMPPLVLMDLADTTSTLENRAALVGFNRLVLNVLLANALAGTAVTQASLEAGMRQGAGTFYSLYPFLNADAPQDFYGLLQANGYLDANGNVQASALPVPPLDLSGTEFAGSETAVLQSILALWSGALKEMPVVNGYDEQGRATSVADPRFVWNNYDACAAWLFASN